MENEAPPTTYPEEAPLLKRETKRFCDVGFSLGDNDREVKIEIEVRLGINVKQERVPQSSESLKEEEARAPITRPINEGQVKIFLSFRHVTSSLKEIEPCLIAYLFL